MKIDCYCLHVAQNLCGEQMNPILLVTQRVTQNFNVDISGQRTTGTNSDANCKGLTKG